MHTHTCNANWKTQKKALRFERGNFYQYNGKNECTHKLTQLREINFSEAKQKKKVRKLFSEVGKSNSTTLTIVLHRKTNV